MENNAGNIQQAVPFFAVTNMQRSLQFYVQGLGFQLKITWPGGDDIRWCYLENGRAGIMLQQFPKEAPHTWDHEGKLGLGVAICFICADALQIYQQITSRGIQASEPFVGNGMWNTSVHDPDGYRLEFESYTTVPEETKLTEWNGLLSE